MKDSKLACIDFDVAYPLTLHLPNSLPYLTKVFLIGCVAATIITSNC